MLVKKNRSKVLPKRTPTILFQKKDVLNLLSKSRVQRAVENTGEKLFPGKICVEINVMFHFRKKRSKPPSTVSKCSSESYCTKVLPKTPSMKRNQETRDLEFSSKCYL